MYGGCVLFPLYPLLLQLESLVNDPGWVGDSAYERGGDASRLA